MNRTFRLLSFLLAAFATSAAFATDYAESEPNDSFPPSFLPGDPVFNPGADNFVGSLSTASDQDLQYIRTSGTGSAGLYRYTFSLNSNGGDSILYLYDHTASGYFLGTNDDVDYPTDLSSRVTFDLFDSGAINTWGIGVLGYETFDYSLSITRTQTPVTSLGALGAGTTTENFTPFEDQANWYSFTLGSESNVNLDTLLSDPSADTEIALFDASGNTLIGNDDADPSNGEYRSALSTHLLAGTYFVSVGSYLSRFNYDETAGAQLGWDRNGFSSGFSQGVPLALSIGVSPVPEPATLLALGVGAAALLRRRRRA